ncbi:MAG: serine hydrolase domain-containing protein [Pseudomonadota bacterium]
MNDLTRRRALCILAATPVVAGYSSVAADTNSGGDCSFGDLFTLRERTVREMGVPSINAAIVRDGQVRFSAAVGYADLDQRREIRTATVQNFGSTTKMVTMTAALQLVECGKLSLTESIDDQLGFPVRNPAFPDQPISLGQLICPSSSILEQLSG